MLQDSIFPNQIRRSTKFECGADVISFHPLFLEQVIKRELFSGAGYQNKSNGEICLDRVVIQYISCVFEYTFNLFFWNEVSFEGKNSGARSRFRSQ